MSGKRRLTKKQKSARRWAYVLAGLFVCTIFVVGLFRPSNRNNNRPTARPQSVATNIPVATSASVDEPVSTTTEPDRTATVNTTVESQATLMQQARETSRAAPTETNAPATPRPTIAPTDAPSGQSADVREVSPTTYYTTGQVNMRECPSTGCASLGQIASGVGLVVNGEAEGDAVTAGNAIWYRVAYNGQIGYVYSGLMSQNAPSVNASGSTGGGSTSGAQSNAHPGNCSTAVAMGLSAQQAAAAGLDRDGDGEACYGN